MTRLPLALCVLAVVACTDATTPSNDDGSGGSAVNVTTSASGGRGGGGGGTGNAGGASAAGGTGGTAGAGGEGAGCPDIPIGDGMPLSCDDVGAGALSLADTTLCPADTSVFWPAKVYAVPVAAGDCLFMQADNAGSPLGADLFGAIVEPGGKSILYDEEMPCSVENPEGYDCPAGGATMEASGTAYVMVGIWEGDGCAPQADTPFTLDVAVNGVDVELSSSFVCAGDLLEIIP